LADAFIAQFLCPVENRGRVRHEEPTGGPVALMPQAGDGGVRELATKRRWLQEASVNRTWTCGRVGKYSVRQFNRITVLTQIRLNFSYSKF
jgi:hypothetical protein